MASPPSCSSSKLPRYDARLGSWTGGDTRTLYAFTDERTGRVRVEGGRGRYSHRRQNYIPVGSAATVRCATREEAARAGWPVEKGWTVEG